jgi:uncharacterized protein (DUF433 family)
MKQFSRITVDPNPVGRILCARGLQILAAAVVGIVSEGMTDPEILTAKPDLQL